MMRAIVVDPSRSTGMRLSEVPQTIPTARHVLIDVKHISLNLAEIHMATSGVLPPRLILGWDAAGIVVSAAREACESGRTIGEYGPTIGDRVVTHGRSGGWAQRRTVTVDNLAIVPESMDLAAAAALPVSGCTALGLLRSSGSTLGRRILITGAGGGVGRFAVQLAALGGAYVIASVGSQSRAKGLVELGAHEVVIGLNGITEPVDIILDSVGGQQMVEAFGGLAPGGILQSFGSASHQPSVFPPYSLTGPRRSLTSYALPSALKEDMTTLLGMVADGRLRVDIGWRGTWDRHDDAAEALLSRQVNGKVVLDVS